MAQVSCPDFFKKHSISSVQIFDGPPSELTSLLPRDGGWDLSEDNYKISKRYYYIECKYKDTKETVVVKIPPTATVCEMHGYPEVHCH